MRNQVKTVSASQPTTQPVERKCATCAHCNDFAYECQQHDQTAVYRDGYRIVVQCDGYTEAGQ
jgi:hypothetical protein